MVYCPSPSPVQDFTFTAFSGSDLLIAGDRNLGCNDTFTMPATATVCITVRDDDSRLSGDTSRNEHGDDRTWQRAAIETDGVESHGNAKIYAEEYYILQGDDGRCYYMIEVEVYGSVEGDTDDFYTFYGNVPAAGVGLTIAAKCNVRGDWLHYHDLSAGLKWDLNTQGKITVEAEQMALSGYKVDQVAAASGGEVIRLKKHSGEASITFGAEAGTYDLELSYIDENDGEGEIEIWVGATLLAAIALEQNTDGNGGYGSTVSTATFKGVTLSTGDVITLRGTRDAWEFARIDALTFCAVQNAPPVAVDDFATTNEGTPVTLDLLGNDRDPDNDVLQVLSLNHQSIASPIAVTSQNGRTGHFGVTAAGILTFDPGDAFNSMSAGQTDVVSLSYQITDGNGETASATARITIEGSNAPPIAGDDRFTVNERGLTVLDITPNDTDPEGDVLTYSLVSQPIEGSVSLNGDRQIVFNPGQDFLALERGQSATVTFQYRVSDGQFEDIATVTVQVLGEGICVPEIATTSAIGALESGQTVTVLLEAPDVTKDGTAEFSIRANIGDASTKYHFVYALDISASTGVADSFAPGQTVLDAEIEALTVLTEDILSLGLPEGSIKISIIPFNDPADLSAPVPGTGFPVFTFGDGTNSPDLAAITDSLATLEPLGQTNYLAAVGATSQAVLQNELQNGNATNVVYFLSDGNPFPQVQPPAVIGGFASFLKSQATVHAVGLLNDGIEESVRISDTTFLDPIDNTGSATLVDDLATLVDALDVAPVDQIILFAELAIAGTDGALLDTFTFAAEDFEETPMGFELNLGGTSALEGLERFTGESNTATLTIELDGNHDGVADDTVTLNATIEGMLPRSFDIV